MQRDIRHTDLYKALEADALRTWQPGSGLICEGFDLQASPDARRLCFTARVVDQLVGTPGTRLAILDVERGDPRFVTGGSGSQQCGRWSPDGSHLAFLSDRERAGSMQLYVMPTDCWRAHAGPQVEGFVESLQWHADGRRLLLGVAGLGADLAGAQGGTNAALLEDSAPDWAPEVHAGASEAEWRRAWLADLEAGTARAVSPAGLNVWESVWCGADALLASASDAPEEGAWYQARIVHIDLASQAQRTLYTPEHHLGGLCASPSGRQAAVIEAICSDRTIVAGDIVLIDVETGSARRVDAAGADVTQLVWQGESRLLFAGIRGFETVQGCIDLDSGEVETRWRSETLTFGKAMYPEFCPLAGERVAAVIEGFAQRPTLALLSREGTQPLLSLGSPEAEDDLRPLVGSITPMRWTAPDGLEIHGWLLRPPGEGPQPTVLEVHGGPVWQFRPRWLGGSLARRALLRAGYAQLLVNPRGSSGRGQAYAAQVFGDMGGADTQDFLSGMDALVARGVADPRNLFVYGGSYGGYMSSWLVTQDTRFAAAVPFSPVTHWVSQHLTSQIPFFCELFLADEIANPRGRYFTRSPVVYAANVKTPVLNICGALDRNTPPGQAHEFHTALLGHGATSALLTYPQEGHGVRRFPTVIDFAARVLGWFERHRRSS